jgi:PAS domain S-box-containing protein
MTEYDLSDVAAVFAECAEALPAACFIADPTGFYRWANPVYAELAETDPVGLDQQSLPAPALELLRRCLSIPQRDTPRRITGFRFARSNGRPTWLSGMTFPLRAGERTLTGGVFFPVDEHAVIDAGDRADPPRGSDGGVLGTAPAVVDIAGREPALSRESIAEQRLRQIVENSPALIDIRDAENRVLLANPAFVRVFGGVGAVPPMSDRPAGLTEASRLARETGQVRIWQGQLSRPDGRRIDLFGHLFPLPLDDGSPGLAEAFLDISGQEEARRLLAESEHRYRTLFDSAGIGVLLLGVDGHIVDANPAIARITGRAAGEIRGQPIDIITTQEGTAAISSGSLELIHGRRSRQDTSFTVCRADGRLVPTRLTMILVRDAGGAPAHFLAQVAPLDMSATGLRTSPRSRPTPAEAAVLERLASGRTQQQIADELGLTRRGIDYRITRLRQRLRTDEPGGEPATSAALVARAYALGILHPFMWPPHVVERDQPVSQKA